MSDNTGGFAFPANHFDLVEALRWCIRQMPEPVLPGQYTDDYRAARAVLKKMEGKV